MASALSAKQPELSRLKGVLKAKQAELLSGLGNREGIAIEPAADDLDKIQYAAERDITIAKLHLDSVLLRAVRAALTRMTGGHYGACLHCDGKHH